MNIFYLDKDPKKAAEMHFDTHVRKMIVESAQMLSTAHRVLDGQAVIKHNSIGSRMIVWELDDELNEVLYKSTHVNHPCNLWIRESAFNYIYTYKLMVELLREYEYRFGKIHATKRLLVPLHKLPKNIPRVSSTEFKQAVGTTIVESDPVRAYRRYYLEEKIELYAYTKRQPPKWIEEVVTYEASLLETL